MRARLILPIVLAAVLGGCGGAGGASGEFEGAEADVAEAIEQLESSGTRQESADEICRDLLTEDLVRRLAAGGSSCESEIRQAIADADLFDLRVTDVTVQGDNAIAEVVSAAGDSRAAATVRLARERGDWRVGDIRSAG
ncbi:MAG: hypothetical protein AVDCRST_MAG69-1732 [uncultured Solirubrobacteraceae bacterium]|uniref:DUF4878 domain-containing protein n=1 Tax=uncultured Solirubrobacteraceae bacterium TaxID=1162706 RepID=A0A6J4SMZ0_9ACTN|nr:MAG: hypothetical protein AVDCRST_MAG69-1732 [uncultured Solirubrobacteraceae bacterium]